MVDSQLGNPEGRRKFLSLGFRVMTTCFSLPHWNVIAGCSQDQTVREAATFKIPLAMVPLGKRTRVENYGRPVELIRSPEGIIARSLLCTHQGCKVSWHEDRQLYICPCHEGKYDAGGEVVYGMPRKPLKLLRTTIEGAQVVVAE